MKMMHLTRMAAVTTLVCAVVWGSAAEAQRNRLAARYTARTSTVPVPVYVYGARLETDALMLKRVARTVLPMRALFTSVGAQVVWNSPERAVYAWRTDGTGVRFGLGEIEAQSLVMPAPGERATVTEARRLDAPAQLIGGRVYIPVRAAAEMLGTGVRWDGSVPAIYLGQEPAGSGIVDGAG